MADAIAASGAYLAIAGCSLIRIGAPFALTVPDEVLDLEAIRPALLRLRDLHVAMCPACPAEPCRCEWGKLPEAWQRWAEAGS